MMDHLQKSKITVFILDMEHNTRELVRRWMVDQGYRILVFQETPSCLDAADTDPPDILIADVLTTSLSGIEIVDKFSTVAPDALVILMYQQRLTDTAMKSVYRGAFDFHAKPLDRTRLSISVRNAAKMRTLEIAIRQLRNEQQTRKRRSSMPPMSGMGLSMKDLERKAIKDALAAAGGNVSKAARTLGLGRTTMYRKMSAFGIGSFKTGAATPGATSTPSEAETRH